MARGNADSYRVRFFLYWAATHDLVPRLSVPRRPQSAPERILDDTDRWALLRRCLTDETMPLDTRAAAALILLYGLPLSRVRHLRIDQLDLHGPRRLLRIGRCPLLLPPRLAGLLGRLAERPHTRSRVVTEHTGSRWLFPGLTPGRPASEGGFHAKLRAYNIEVLPSRHAGLIALAGELPTSVLADMLGLSTSTALAWAALARRDWTTYIAERAGDQSASDGASGPRSSTSG